MRQIRTMSMLVSLMVVALMSVGVASAAPTNAPNAETLPLECDNGVTYTIVANGNGLFSPGHIIDGDGVNLIPVAFTFEGIDADGNVIFSETVAKRGQMQGLTSDLITCTFEEPGEQDGEPITIVVTVTLVVVPRS